MKHIMQTIGPISAVTLTLVALAVLAHHQMHEATQHELELEAPGSLERQQTAEQWTNFRNRHLQQLRNEAAQQEALRLNTPEARQLRALQQADEAALKADPPPGAVER